MGTESEEEAEGAYERFEKVYNYRTLQNAYRAMQRSQKEINNIWNDPSIDPDEKRAMVDDLYLQMIDFAKAVNEDVQEHRLIQKNELWESCSLDHHLNNSE